ncbi:hypothetical protein GGP41_004762, partial [Bipolaris sorokiniana]
DDINGPRHRGLEPLTIAKHSRQHVNRVVEASRRDYEKFGCICCSSNYNGKRRTGVPRYERDTDASKTVCKKAKACMCAITNITIAKNEAVPCQTRTGGLGISTLRVVIAWRI